MRLILAVLLFIPLMAISCDDKEFQYELELIRQILVNPENMSDLIKNSALYDTTYLNISHKDFRTEI